jgi:HEAT repeat protein
MSRYGRWYIPGRDPRYLRRNALIALANTADGRSAPVVSTLKQYLESPDELLRAHAVWAALRLGRAELVDDPLEGPDRLADDPSALVQAELGRRSEVVPASSTGVCGSVSQIGPSRG